MVVALEVIGIEPRRESRYSSESSVALFGFGVTGRKYLPVAPATGVRYPGDSWCAAPSDNIRLRTYRYP